MLISLLHASLAICIHASSASMETKSSEYNQVDQDASLSTSISSDVDSLLFGQESKLNLESLLNENFSSVSSDHNLELKKQTLEEGRVDPASDVQKEEKFADLPSISKKDQSTYSPSNFVASENESAKSLLESHASKDNIIASKDKTIASLSAINDELLSEIKRLKLKRKQSGDNPEIDSVGVDKSQSLIVELNNVRNNLLMKSSEIRDLKLRNDSLERRIRDLEDKPLPVMNLKPTNPQIFGESPDMSVNAKVALTNIPDPARDFSSCDLTFDAVVTSLNGKSKEAFYTEFFILPDELENILRKGKMDLSKYKDIETFAELWARSRKNSFLYPDIQKQIRYLLLDYVEQGLGKRVRTDINGNATIRGMIPDNYYIIGTASLGKVGVTWNFPVRLREGTNKLSLTLSNASWSL